MPTTTQLASLVVSAFDTFLIVDNSCQSVELFNDQLLFYPLTPQVDICM